MPLICNHFTISKCPPNAWSIPASSIITRFFTADNKICGNGKCPLYGLTQNFSRHNFLSNSGCLGIKIKLFVPRRILPKEQKGNLFKKCNFSRTDTNCTNMQKQHLGQEIFVKQFNSRLGFRQFLLFLLIWNIRKEKTKMNGLL